MVHTLVLLQTPPYAKGFFMCGLCREKGSGAVYHCSACHFDLHPTCIATGEQTSHFSHFDHPLCRQETISGDKTCDLCGDTACPTVYHCDECDFDAHPHCARAPRFIRHSCHKHTLQLTSAKDAYSGYCYCDACGKEATDGIYHCCSCEFDLHISCAMLPWNPYHPKHPEHRLRLYSKPVGRLRNVSCVECGKDAPKCAYGCKLCGFLLHLDCANIPRHEVASGSASILGDSNSLTTLNDIEMVVKMMDRILVSLAENFTVCEGTAARKVIKMLEQQQHGVPVDLAPVASRLIQDGDNNTCPTCLEEYASEKQRRYLRCGHHFHTGCILRWLDRSNRCPVCRQQVMFVDGS